MPTNNSANFGTGTAGQVLTSNGAGIAPTFQGAGTGNLVLLQQQTPSGVASVTFNTNISATYTTYLFVFTNITCATGVTLNLQVSNGGAFATTNYLSGVNFFAYNSATITNSNLTTSVLLATGISTTNANSANGICWCYGIETGGNPFFISDFSVKNNFREMGTATNTGITGITQFKILPDTGNFSGTITLFGVLE